jgi:hypothetical protein
MSKENSNFLCDITSQTRQKISEAFANKIEIEDLDGQYWRTCLMARRLLKLKFSLFPFKASQ